MDDVNVKDISPPNASEDLAVKETISDDILREKVIPEESFSDVSPDKQPYGRG